MPLAQVAPPPKAPIVTVPEVKGSTEWRDWIRTFTGTITGEWLDYLVLAVTSRVQAAPAILRTVSLTGQSAAIATTPMPLPQVTKGLYAVRWALRITTPATTSSSVTLTIGSTDNGQGTTQASAALTANDASKPLSGQCLVKADGGTAITYATAYTSVGATSAVYQVDLECEQVG